MARCPKCNCEYDETLGGCVHCEQPILEDGIVQHYIEQDPSLRFRKQADANGTFSTILKIFVPLLLIALLFLLYHIFKNVNARPPSPVAAVAPPAPVRTAEVAVAPRRRPDPPRPAVVPPSPKPKTFDAVLSFSEGLAGFSLDGKFGYMDKTGKAVIQNRFDDAWWFQEGLAAVKNGDKWGFIDKSGKTAIDFKFDEALPYSDGIAPVKIGDKWGYVDKLGAMAIEPQFEYAWWFSEGRAYAMNGTGVIIDKTGKTVFKLELPGDTGAMDKHRAEIKVRGCWKIEAAGGKRVFRPGYSYSEGLACITRIHRLAGGSGESPDRNIVFNDYSGKAVIEEQIKAASDGNSFSDGRALVKISGKAGFIDKSGKLVIATLYDDAKSFSEGLAAVKIGDKWGYIDQSGKLVIDCRFEAAYNFSEDVAGVTSGGSWIYVDKKGDRIIDPRCEDVCNFYEGMAVVKSGGAWGFIDKNGVKIVSPK